MAAVIQFRSRNVILEAHVKLCTRLSIHDIPELEFSESIISLAGHLIIRADHQRGSSMHVQHLDHQWELTSEI